MGRSTTSPVLALLVVVLLGARLGSAKLSQNYYDKICPNVESIVRKAVEAKFQQTFTTVPATLRLFFHDCMVNGCDASVMIQSTDDNQAEKDHPDNQSLAGDGFDTVAQAKAALDAIPECQNKVSCADILALATRDVVNLAGGPSYPVELGRLDGLTSTASSVNGKLPQPTQNVDQLNAIFASVGLTQTDLVAVSAAHTVGFSHCSKMSNRIYNFSASNPVDPTLDKDYALQLQAMCPKDVDPRVAINLDPVTPKKFDNQYYINLQQGKGLFTSDEVLFTDKRTKPLVNAWAYDTQAFFKGFAAAMTNLGRVGVKTKPGEGNIRYDCFSFN